MRHSGSPSPLLQNRVEVHDRKQLEIKLEYQPTGREAKARYSVEFFLFLPDNLNVREETYPREDFYADIHNYVRLKTPVMEMREVLTAAQSPLGRLEALVASGRVQPESEIIYQAKLLSCIFKATLRRFVRANDLQCRKLGGLNPPPSEDTELEGLLRHTVEGAQQMLSRFRAVSRTVTTQFILQERTRASLRLVDEYLSLSVEQFFRGAVADMEKLPRTGVFLDLRSAMMAEVLREERYRSTHALRSVISPTGDNEEYLHRLSFLKKFCMNILWLAVRRETTRRHYEELMLSLAAGCAMAIALGIGAWAQSKVEQASLSLFFVLVVVYMAKDRIKEALRRSANKLVSKHIYDRSATLSDPVTKMRIGVCEEKVDYGNAARVPAEITTLRQRDDFITVSQGELSEQVIRYKKEIVLDSEMLPKVRNGIPGVTDIIRFNVHKLLKDMDDPEYNLEYVDMGDFSVAQVKGAKSYQIDLAFRFHADDADQAVESFQVVRLVLDRNGIKRLIPVAEAKLDLPATSPTTSPTTSPSPVADGKGPEPTPPVRSVA